MYELNILHTTYYSASVSASKPTQGLRPRDPAPPPRQLRAPLSMPPDQAEGQVRALFALEKTVAKCYLPAPFTLTVKQVEYLFDLNEKKYMMGLLAAEKPKRKKR